MAVILPSAYRDGTTSVTQGSTAVEGHGTLFKFSVLPGDWYSTDDGFFIMISNVVDDTHLELIAPYPGSTISQGSYSIMLQSDIARMQETTRQLLETLRNGNLVAFAGLVGSVDKIPMFTGPGSMTLVDRSSLVSSLRYDAEVQTLADRDEYNGESAGFRVLVLDTDGSGRAAFYNKTGPESTDWSNPIYLTGPVGPTGPLAVITASAVDLPPGSSATATTTPTSDGYNVEIGIPASRGNGNPYIWSTSTTNESPGAGVIKANDASLGSANMVLVSKTSASGSNVASFLIGLASSTNETTKGDLIIQASISGETAIFGVLEVEDEADYVRVLVSSHSGSESFLDDIAVNLSFNRAGDKGLDGTGVGDVVGPDGGTTTNGLVGFSNNTGKRIKALTVAEAVTGLGPVWGGKFHPSPSSAGVGLSEGDFGAIDVPGVYSIVGDWINGPAGASLSTYSGILVVSNRAGLGVRQEYSDFVPARIGQNWERVGSRSSVGDAWAFSQWKRAGGVIGPDGGAAENQVAGFSDSSGGAIKALTPEQVRVYAQVPKGGYAGRDYLINGNFRRWLRSTSQTNSGYGSHDRWQNIYSSSVMDSSRVSFTPGQTEVPGFPRFYVRTNWTPGPDAAASLAIKGQTIWDVTKLAGKTVTVTFWARSSYNRPLPIELYQAPGSGGGASPESSFLAGTVNVTTGWQRFSILTTLPSLTGKVLGSNDDSRTEFIFWLDAGTNFSARTGGMARMPAGWIDLSMVSIVDGDATGEGLPVPYYDPDIENRRMDYYAQIAVFTVRAWSPSAGEAFCGPMQWPEMRRSPDAILIEAGIVSNASDVNLYNIGKWGCRPEVVAAGSGSTYAIARGYLLNAEA